VAWSLGVLNTTVSAYTIYPIIVESVVPVSMGALKPASDVRVKTGQKVT